MLIDSDIQTVVLLMERSMDALDTAGVDPVLWRNIAHAALAYSNLTLAVIEATGSRK